MTEQRGWLHNGDNKGIQRHHLGEKIFSILFRKKKRSEFLKY